jgi:hypothetical protein
VLCGDGESVSCAGRRSTIETKKAQQHSSRVIIRRLPSRSTVAEQARCTALGKKRVAKFRAP